jgi:hypothetical protein
VRDRAGDAGHDVGNEVGAPVAAGPLQHRRMLRGLDAEGQLCLAAKLTIWKYTVSTFCA